MVKRIGTKMGIVSVTNVKIKVLKRDTNCAKIKEVPFWEVYEEKKLKKI
jgi:hypothetical protein